jgi:hypothetical protein
VVKESPLSPDGGLLCSRIEPQFYKKTGFGKYLSTYGTTHFTSYSTPVTSTSSIVSKLTRADSNSAMGVIPFNVMFWSTNHLHELLTAEDETI